MPAPHPWAFQPRFRRNAFGWRSQPAVTRIREAVREIRGVAKRDPKAAAEGVVLFLERVAPAIGQVDGSSGSLGTAVNAAIEALVQVFAGAPLDEDARRAGLERLFQALQDDDMPYLERLADHWGMLCATKEIASEWADELRVPTEAAWRESGVAGFSFPGTTACLSALVAAERHEEVLELIERAPFAWWDYRKFGVLALVAKGKPGEALRYAEESRTRNAPTREIDLACERILLDAGFVDEAYRRYGLNANRATTYLATFRAVAKKYPAKEPRELLLDLAGSTPGDKGKWFAAAKEAGLFAEALDLIARSPCDPRTLLRAARDHRDTQPAFAVGAGLAALRWIERGAGYDITVADVRAAFSATLAAAERLADPPDVRAEVRAILAAGGLNARFLTEALERHLAR